jgi:hypothetical protein
MPIKPEERHEYGSRKGWLARRARRLERDGSACARAGECGDRHVEPGPPPALSTDGRAPRALGG